jgi:hypothetical protein
MCCISEDRVIKFEFSTIEIERGGTCLGAVWIHIWWVTPSNRWNFQKFSKKFEVRHMVFGAHASCKGTNTAKCSTAFVAHLHQTPWIVRVVCTNGVVQKVLDEQKFLKKACLNACSAVCVCIQILTTGEKKCTVYVLSSHQSSCLVCVALVQCVWWNFEFSQFLREI